jgi:predicted regulator of Ras-like GTPase activity (Roadblock/LC7/MglB family)
MNPAEALSDLTEISTQIEAAVIFDQSGEVAGSTVADDERSKRMARSARALLDAAESRGDGDLAQLEVSLREGSVFVVRHEGQAIAATTGVQPTVGLVFYDLKTCLRRLAEEPPKRKRAPAKTPAKKTTRSRTRKKPESESS